MPEKKNRVEVVISRETYVLRGADPPEYMEMLASQLGERLDRVQNMNTRLSLYQTAILTALNILDEYVKLREDHRSLLNLLEDQAGEKK